MVVDTLIENISPAYTSILETANMATNANSAIQSRENWFDLNLLIISAADFMNMGYVIRKRIANTHMTCGDSLASITPTVDVSIQLLSADTLMN